MDELVRMLDVNERQHLWTHRGKEEENSIDPIRMFSESLGRMVATTGSQEGGTVS